MSGTYQDSDVIASDSFRKLDDFLRRTSTRGPGGRPDFEEFERDLHAHMMALESDLVAAELARYDLDAEEIDVHGARYRRKGEFEQEYHGLSGSFVVRRSLYGPKSGRGRGVVPLELRAGIVSGAWTPLLARVMTRAVASTTPREAAELFKEFGGATPSPSSLDRLPKGLSEVWESRRAEFESLIRSQETIPPEAVSVGAAIDGVLIPMKREKGTSREPSSRRSSGPRDFQEASCATISFYDGEGERIDTVRYARAPEHKKKTLKEQVTTELESIFLVRPDLTLVCLSDAAPDHWEYLSGLQKELEIKDVRAAADFFHVAERIKKALDAYHGESTPESRAEFEKCRIWLKEKADGADRVLRALRYRRNRSDGAVKKTIDEQIRYVEKLKRAGLVDYKKLLDENLPIGSGVVEAACKTLATQRLKCSGMSWSYEGAEAILTFRSLVQSNRWERAWKILAVQYRMEVQVVTPARRRAA